MLSLCLVHKMEPVRDANYHHPSFFQFHYSSAAQLRVWWHHVEIPSRKRCWSISTTPQKCALFHSVLNDEIGLAFQSRGKNKFYYSSFQLALGPWEDPKAVVANRSAYPFSTPGLKTHQWQQMKWTPPWPLWSFRPVKPSLVQLQHR